MNERIQRIERLLEVTRNLGPALDVETFLQSIIAVASELTDSEAASLLVSDEEERCLRFAAAPWFHRETLRETRVPIEHSAAGWVFTHAQPLVIQDVARDSRHYKTIDEISGIQTRSLLGVPLLFQGQAIGVLEVINKAHGAYYTEDDITILETLASPAAMAIHTVTLERRLKKMSQELAELDQMKSDFIAIASHELRTPLGLILGHATFLREMLGENHREQLDIIIRNAERLKEIVESLSNVENVQSGMARLRRRKVSMSRLIEEVTASFQEEAQRKGLTLRTEIQREGPPLDEKDDLTVEGDATKITIALSNLIKNALTFTNKGGHVFVTAERIPGYVKVSVIDDGIGIPAKDLPRIFERFYQVESHLTRRHGGMGLGLSVAKAMIEMHGGRIWAESVEGKGSNFTFLLPLDSEQAAAARRFFS